MAAMTRERIVDLIRELRKHTVESGCTPGEAAKFAAKAAEWIERYQVEEAELRARSGEATPDDLEPCENILRTGKKVFNPGMSALISSLGSAMCCRVILLHDKGEAVYGVMGDSLDADYVCQICTILVPSLTMQARLEGIEHGHEKAALIRWTNQYLIGAGNAIFSRIEAERAARSATKVEAQRLTNNCTALTVITGETIATAKRKLVEDLFNEKYPHTKTVKNRTPFDPVARSLGREAGKRVGLNIPLNG